MKRVDTHFEKAVRFAVDTVELAHPHDLVPSSSVKESVEREHNDIRTLGTLLLGTSTGLAIASAAVETVVDNPFSEMGVHMGVGGIILGAAISFAGRD